MIINASISDVRENFAEYVIKCVKGNPIVIIRRKEPVMVMLEWNVYSAVMDIVGMLNDNDDRIKILRNMIREYKKGERQ